MLPSPLEFKHRIFAFMDINVKCPKIEPVDRNIPYRDRPPRAPRTVRPDRLYWEEMCEKYGENNELAFEHVRALYRGYMQSIFDGLAKLPAGLAAKRLDVAISDVGSAAATGDSASALATIRNYLADPGTNPAAVRTIFAELRTADETNRMFDKLEYGKRPPTKAEFRAINDIVELCADIVAGVEQLEYRTHPDDPYNIKKSGAFARIREIAEVQSLGPLGESQIAANPGILDLLTQSRQFLILADIKRIRELVELLAKDDRNAHDPLAFMKTVGPRPIGHMLTGRNPTLMTIISKATARIDALAHGDIARANAVNGKRDGVTPILPMGHVLSVGTTPGVTGLSDLRDIWQKSESRIEEKMRTQLRKYANKYPDYAPNEIIEEIIYELSAYAHFERYLNLRFYYATFIRGLASGEAVRMRIPTHVKTPSDEKTLTDKFLREWMVGKTSISEMSVDNATIVNIYAPERLQEEYRSELHSEVISKEYQQELSKLLREITDKLAKTRTAFVARTPEVTSVMFELTAVIETIWRKVYIGHVVIGKLVYILSGKPIPGLKNALCEWHAVYIRVPQMMRDIMRGSIPTMSASSAFSTSFIQYTEAIVDMARKFISDYYQYFSDILNKVISMAEQSMDIVEKDVDVTIRDYKLPKKREPKDYYGSKNGGRKNAAIKTANTRKK